METPFKLTEKIKASIISWFVGLPKTQQYLSTIIGFPFTSTDQKARAWKIAEQIAEAENKRLTQT